MKRTVLVPLLALMLAPLLLLSGGARAADEAKAPQAVPAKAAPVPAAAPAPAAEAKAPAGEAKAANTPDAGAAEEEAPAPAAGETQTVPDPTQDAGGYLKAAWKAVQEKKWMCLAAVILIGIVSSLRKFSKSKYGGEKLKWMSTDRGGVILSVSMAVLGGVAHAGLAGATGTYGGEQLMDSIMIAVLASGGYTMTKKVKGKKAPPAPAAEAKA